MFFETFKLMSTGLVIESVVKDKCPSQWKRILTRVACLVIEIVALAPLWVFESD